MSDVESVVTGRLVTVTAWTVQRQSAGRHLRPFGAGKSTVVRELMAELPAAAGAERLGHHPAAAAGRGGGVDYYFLTPSEFAAAGERGRIPGVQGSIRPGDWYGTLQSQVTSGLAAGKWVILEIDVEGRWRCWSKHPEALTIFVHSGSIEELERRLRPRNTETEEAIPAGCDVARRELGLRRPLPLRSHQSRRAAGRSRDLRDSVIQSR